MVENIYLFLIDYAKSLLLHPIVNGLNLTFSFCCGKELELLWFFHWVSLQDYYKAKSRSGLFILILLV